MVSKQHAALATGEQGDTLPRPHALIVVGDVGIRAMIRFQLRAGLAETTTETSSENQARRLITKPDPPQLLVASLRHETHAGTDLIALCREHSPDCVILAVDKVCDNDSAADALAAGADDVICAPFSERELEARLRKRLHLPASPSCNAQSDAILSRAAFTIAEIAIMKLLLDRKGQIVTRNQLSQKLHGRDWVYGDRRFDVHITKIRKKLREAFGTRYSVKTIRSLGYILQDEAQD